MAITAEPFDVLLTWLDKDRDSAGRKYETIRSGLIRIFVARGFSDAEDLADETITRVVKRLPDIIESYVGEPAKYFHGVARNVILEAGRRKEIATDVSTASWIQTAYHDDEYDCLMRCLKFLTPAKRELILDYYVYEGHAKVEHHDRMANELGITKGALRLRAHHIRVDLEKCVVNCIQTLKNETKRVAGNIVGGVPPDRSLSHGRSGTA